MINGSHQFTLVQQRNASRKPVNDAFSSLSFRGKRGYQQPYNFITNKMEITDETSCRDFKALLEGSVNRKSEKKAQQQQKERSKVYGAILRCSTVNRTSYALVQGRYTGKWSFPKGHSDGDESPYQCALRELNEETGLTELPNPVDFVKIGFGNYYIFEVDQEYELKPKDTNEVMDTKWASLEELKNMTLNVDASGFRKQLECGTFSNREQINKS
jgi:8-oxo-dGTP pyrophosphatase MutT (NUDIX family)